jgi:lysophospholipase L1-like esterase
MTTMKRMLVGALGLLTSRPCFAADAPVRAGAGGQVAGKSTLPGLNAAASAADVMKKAIERREDWRRARRLLLANDFGETQRYRKANLILGEPAPREKRVVFIGDSIVEGWPLSEFFPDKGYLNRGIGGQTTSQVLLRFRQDVIDLQPTVVVILLGTNDLAGNTGPISIPDIEKNFASLAELARVHGIAVVLSSVLPVHNYTPASDFAFPLRPPAQIVELNRWLKAYCQDNGHVYLDFFSAMIDAQGLLKKSLAEDGLHPNRAGYLVMTPLAVESIGKALTARAGSPPVDH